MLERGRATENRKRGGTMRKKRVETEWIKIAIGLDSSSKTAIFLDVVLKALDFEQINIENEAVKVVFDTIKDDVQKEAEKQKETSDNRRKAGSKGGKTKWEKERQAQANHKQSDAPPKSPKNEAEFFSAEQMEEFPFSEFYSIFPNHTDRKDAEEKWKKMTNEKRKLAFEGAKRYAAYIEYRKKYEKNVKVLMPTTYLNKERWEDEYEIPSIDNQNANNYGSNNRQYNNREAQRQQNLREMGEWLAEAAANVQPINPTESGI